MGFLSRLFRKRSAPAPGEVILDPLELRRRLFDAAASIPTALPGLCQANREMILREFKHWTIISAFPDVDPKDPQQLQYVANGLGMIAEVFREQLNEPKLWELITRPGDNPMEKFDEVVKKAQSLLEQMQFDQSIELLTQTLIDSKGLLGSGVDRFRGFAHGIMGHAYFHSGRVADSVGHYQQALTNCELIQDTEGVGVYLYWLYEANRYLAKTQEAADFLERLAKMHAGTAKEQKYLKQAAVVRAGEPLMRMKVQAEDQEMELEEGLKVSGRIQLYFQRNRPTLRSVSKLLEEGGKSVSAGKPEEALDYCRQAAKIDPFDPEPHYKAGSLLLLLARYAEGLDEFAKVEELAPGWFNVRSDAWLGGELLAGRLEPQDYYDLWRLEDGIDEPARKLNTADALLKRYPHLAHAYLQRARALQMLGRTQDARRALEAGLNTDPEPDIHTRLLMQLITLLDKEQYRAIYEKILAVPNGNMMSQSLAILGLRQL